MTKLYKLTDQDGYTRRGEHNECKWGPNISHSGTGEGELCGPGWIHAYESPLLAVFLNSLHAAIESPLLWECKGTIAKRDGQLKVGCKTITTRKQVALPIVTTEHRIKFAILCALEVYRDPVFVQWAQNWLNGKDRSEAAKAAKAAKAAEAAEVAASWAASWAALAAAVRVAAKPLNLLAIAMKAMEE